MASVQPVDSEIGEGFAPVAISSNTGPDIIHHNPFQSHKNKKGNSMPSVQPVDSEIGEGFAAFSISSNTGPDTIHHNPFRSHKNKKGLGPAAAHDSRSSTRLPPEASIWKGFATNPISSGTESDAGHVEPQVPESAPAESTPGTRSTSDNQKFTGKSHRMLAAVTEKVTKFFKL